MARTGATFAERRARAEDRGDTEHMPYPFHPEPGGLIFWGYDYSGDEHFFVPCDADPDRWKVVTVVHEEGCRTFDGPFSAFVLDFVLRLSEAEPELDHERAMLAALGLDVPEELVAEDLVSEGAGGAVRPSFEAC